MSKCFYSFGISCLKVRKGWKNQEEIVSALSQVREFFARAENASPAMAKKLVAQARRLVQKSRIRLPIQLKRRFCKHCGAFWVPGRNVRVRTRGRKIVYYCLECKTLKRIPVN
jgi:ribonuclease P protein subunit RPR2